MADNVTSQTLYDSQDKAVMKFTNVSDGTGESAVLKVDVSALNASLVNGAACSKVRIKRAHVSISGMSVNMLWDADADVTGFVLAPGVYTFDFEPALWNNAGTGVTGDVMFTTIGHSSGDTYSIVLEMLKTY